MMQGLLTSLGLAGSIGWGQALLIAGVTDVVQSVLDKRRDSVTVIIEEIDPDNWGEGGQTVTRARALRTPQG